MMTVDVEELKRRAAAGEADNEETTLAQRLEDRLGMQQAERVRQLRERAESRASILGGFEDDDLVKVAELATAAAAWCATHDAAVEARRDYLFYRGILAGCAERDAAAVEAAFTTEGETTAAEAAQALRGLKDEAINDLLEAYREAKRTVNRAAAAYRAAQDGRTLAALVEAQGDKTLKAVKETKDALLQKEKVDIPFGYFQTQAEFASHFKEYGVTPVIVSRWRNGKEQPPKGFAWPCPYVGTDKATYLAVKNGIKDWHEAKVNRKKVRELKRDGQYPTARDIEKNILGNNRGKNLNR